jgi:hypothetical protein
MGSRPTPPQDLSPQAPSCRDAARPPIPVIPSTATPWGGAHSWKDRGCRITCHPERASPRVSRRISSGLARPPVQEGRSDLRETLRRAHFVRLLRVTGIGGGGGSTDTDSAVLAERDDPWKSESRCGGSLRLCVEICAVAMGQSCDALRDDSCVLGGLCGANAMAAMALRPLRPRGSFTPPAAPRWDRDPRRVWPVRPR